MPGWCTMHEPFSMVKIRKDRSFLFCPSLPALALASTDFRTPCLTLFFIPGSVFGDTSHADSTRWLLDAKERDDTDDVAAVTQTEVLLANAWCEDRKRLENREQLLQRRCQNDSWGGNLRKKYWRTRESVTKEEDQ